MTEDRAIDCMLFAAGRGSRLRPLTDQTPKPLLKVGGRALLDRQLDALASSGVTSVTVNVSHLGAQIEHHVEERERQRSEPKVSISREREPLETGGGLLAARDSFGGPFLWLLNGDVLFDYPLKDFPRSLPATDDLHLLLVPTPAHREEGDFECDGQRVTGRGADYVYGCLALLRLSAFDHYVSEHLNREPATLEDRPVFSLRGFLFDRVAAGRVSATIHPGPWFDIGTVEQLSSADRWATARQS